MAAPGAAMILHVSPGSPWWIKEAAEAALFLHISGASVGLVAGAMALAVKKGGLAHRMSGDVFVLGMLTMTVVGAIVAPLIGQPTNTIVAAFTFYLVATGWATMQHAANGARRLEAVGVLVAVGIAGLSLWLGGLIADGPDSASEHVAAYVMAAVAILAAGLDLRVILRGGVAGPQRLERHIWRMSAGLFIATASFFLGQQRVLPHGLRGSPLLFVPAFAPLGLMVFWLIRVRGAGRTGLVRRTRSLGSPANLPG